MESNWMEDIIYNNQFTQAQIYKEDQTCCLFDISSFEMEI